MGDPKKLRKKYSPPRHPWQGARIASEKMLVEEFIRKMYQGELQRTNSFEVDSEELAGISEEERQKIIGLMEVQSRISRGFTVETQENIREKKSVENQLRFIGANSLNILN